MIRLGGRVDSRHPRLRRPDVHRRDRQVEQRRRDQGRSSRSAPSGSSRYVSRFGFGQADLSRISAARVRASSGIRRSWIESGLASVSMGYQVGVTPLQMVAAVSSVANGGDALRAAHRARGHQGRTALPVAPKACVARSPTHRRRAHHDHGTGRRARHRASTAQMDGFTIAGKTGTAHKIVDGRYSQSDYNASFVGFVPSRSPALTILVMIDSPHANGYFGGTRGCADLQAHRRSVAAPARYRRTINPRRR